jgi:hypothetical protein
MSLEKKVAPPLILALVIYIVYSRRLSTAIATIGVAALLYALTDSCIVVAIFLAGSLLLKGRTQFDPVGIEAFQARDPNSIHTRIEGVRRPLPLAPKVAQVTGVLESPDILDSTPLQGAATPEEEGASITSIPAPASAKASVAIYAPSEDTIPASRVSENARPTANPFLQNGEDVEGVVTSLFERGTDMMKPLIGASDVAGVGNHGNAY